jgi:hypothetical protein
MKHTSKQANKKQAIERSENKRITQNQSNTQTNKQKPISKQTIIINTNT